MPRVGAGNKSQPSELQLGGRRHSSFVDFRDTMAGGLTDAMLFDSETDRFEPRQTDDSVIVCAPLSIIDLCRLWPHCKRLDKSEQVVHPVIDLQDLHESSFLHLKMPLPLVGFQEVHHIVVKSPDIGEKTFKFGLIE